MPPIEEADLYQTAVLWPKIGESDYSNPLLGERREIACRWVYGAREIITADGQRITLDGMVVVVEEVPNGSLMWEGRATDLVGTAGPDPVNGPLYQVISEKKVVDVRGRETRRELMVMRFRNKLPSV